MNIVDIAMIIPVHSASVNIILFEVPPSESIDRQLQKTEKILADLNWWLGKGSPYYRSVPGKRPLPGKRPCAEFQGITVAASIQTYGIYIPDKHPCGPKSRVMFNRPWALTRDTTVYIHLQFLNKW